MKYFPCLDEWVDPSFFSRGFKVECLNRHWKINVQSSARILDLGFLSRKHCVRGFRRQNKILRNEPFFCHYTCEHSKEKQCSTRYLSQTFIVLVMFVFFEKLLLIVFNVDIWESINPTRHFKKLHPLFQNETHSVWTDAKWKTLCLIRCAT